MGLTEHRTSVIRLDGTTGAARTYHGRILVPRGSKATMIRQYGGILTSTTTAHNKQFFLIPELDLDENLANTGEIVRTKPLWHDALNVISAELGKTWIKADADYQERGRHRKVISNRGRRSNQHQGWLLISSGSATVALVGSIIFEWDMEWLRPSGISRHPVIDEEEGVEYGSDDGIN